MAAAMAPTPLDDAHAVYVRELVFGSASAASRPVVAVAVVRGLLARADALLGRGADLARAPLALAELQRGGVRARRGDRRHGGSGKRHRYGADRVRPLAHGPLRPQPQLAPSGRRRAAGAGERSRPGRHCVARRDSRRDPARRVDAANALGLEGARRAALIELGMLVLDAGGSEARVVALRPVLERLPGARDGAEAIVVADASASKLHARGGSVIAVDAASTAPVTEARSPWGREVAAPSIDEGDAIARPRPGIRRRTTCPRPSPAAASRRGARRWGSGRHEHGGHARSGRPANARRRGSPYARRQARERGVALGRARCPGGVRDSDEGSGRPDRRARGGPIRRAARPPTPRACCWMLRARPRASGSMPIRGVSPETIEAW